MVMNPESGRTMYIAGKFFPCLIAVSVSFLFTVAALSSPLGASGRRGDVVSLRGEELPSLLGTSIERIGGYTSRNGRLEVTPLQIDERDRNGDLIYTKYGGGTTAKRDGKLDSQDEILFMAQDTGERWKGESLPPGAVRGVEIRVIDPLGGPDSWYYLLQFEGRAPRSDVDYVRYDPEKDWIVARYYTVGFPYRKAVQVPSYFACSEEAGGDNRNIYDLYKIRLNIDLKLFGTIERSQDDFLSRPVGYVDGPVRVSRRVKSALRMAGPIRSAMIYNDSYYYAYYCTYPSLLQVPFRMKFIARSASMRITDDLSENARGMVWYNERNADGLEITGTPSAEKKNLDRGPFRWKLASGPQGTLLSLTLFDPNLKDLEKRLYFCDDEEALDGPEQFPGQIGNQGYKLSNLELVPKGSYNIIVYVFCPVDYKKGDEKIYLNSVLKPLTVSVASLPPSEKCESNEVAPVKR